MAFNFHFILIFILALKNVLELWKCLERERPSFEVEDGCTFYVFQQLIDGLVNLTQLLFVLLLKILNAFRCSPLNSMYHSWCLSQRSVKTLR